MPVVDVSAPMAGSLKELLVAVGDQVGKGDELALIESMKMEIPVESPAAGTVAEVVAALGRVDEGQLLLRLSVP